MNQFGPRVFKFLQVQNFINSWAKKHLLYDKAILNIRAKNKISLKWNHQFKKKPNNLPSCHFSTQNNLSTFQCYCLFIYYYQARNKCTLLGFIKHKTIISTQSYMRVKDGNTLWGGKFLLPF